MPEQWKRYRNYPYSVSNWGTVRNDQTGRILRPSNNQDGQLYVRLIFGGEGVIRSLARMVAEAWVEEPNEAFDTVIHLDGNQMNCVPSNLAWRPRAYAIKYNRIFRRARFNAGRFLVTHASFIEVTTQRVQAFDCLADAAITFGVLPVDIEMNLTDNALAKHRGEALQPVAPFEFIFVYI